MELTTKISLIRDSFQKGKDFAIHTKDLGLFNEFIDSCDTDYKTVIIEGVSAGVGYLSLSNKSSFDCWLSFYNKHKNQHAKHLNLGLGWALNKSNSSLDVLDKIHHRWRWRVVDGYGYRAGLFQRRKIQRNQCAPDSVKPEWESAYYQGFGRSLWYTSRGNIDQLLVSINSYPKSAVSDLWRGVGVALSFVGLIDNDALELLLRISPENLKSLKEGVALAVSSISYTHKPSDDLIRIANFFFNDWRKVKEFVPLIEKELNGLGTNYTLLIEQLSTSLLV